MKELYKVYDINYNEVLQVDGAFSALHVQYDSPPVLEGVNDKTSKKLMTERSLLKGNVDAIIAWAYSFDGTEKDIKLNDRISLWKHFWIEYIYALDIMIKEMPHSVVSVYIGRQTIEIGFKYLILQKRKKIEKTHDLGELANMFFSDYSLQDTETYMKWVDTFCIKYCKYIEGNNSEYFRFPEYKRNAYFAGNHLDVNWLLYNMCIIILKLVHFAGLEEEIFSDANDN